MALVSPLEVDVIKGLQLVADIPKGAGSVSELTEVAWCER